MLPDNDSILSANTANARRAHSIVYYSDSFGNLTHPSNIIYYNVIEEAENAV